MSIFIKTLLIPLLSPLSSSGGGVNQLVHILDAGFRLSPASIRHVPFLGCLKYL